MTSIMADGIHNIDNVNTNTNPSFNQVTSTPGDSNVPITSGAGSDNHYQFPNPNNIGTDGGTLTNNNQPLEESTSLNSGILNPGNASTLTNNDQPLEESTSLNRGIAPNTNNISAVGGRLAVNNEPLEESTSSLNSITPSTPGANTNKVLDKESLLRSKLQKLIEGDRECNNLYDDTIITWKNIVDRTKSIVENFGLADTDTTTTIENFEICGNNKDDDGDGFVDETCPEIVDPADPEICGNGIDDDNDDFIDENCPTNQVNPDQPDICNDIDDDGDRLIDEDCRGEPAITDQVIPAQSEICGNGIDDDGDRLIDEACPGGFIDISKERALTDILLESLDITKTTDIDKRDHTTIVGTDKSDYIVGSEEDDLICAKDGNDVVFSDAGVDAIFAQGGMDTVQGGIGNNQIFGGSEGDTLVGGIDDDLIIGRAGDDRLFGAEGNDVLEGDKGADVFNCGEGIDIVIDFNPAAGDIINNDCETS